VETEFIDPFLIKVVMKKGSLCQVLESGTFPIPIHESTLFHYIIEERIGFPYFICY